MAKPKKQSPSNLLTYILIAFVAALCVWGFSSVVQKDKQTTKSEASENTVESAEAVVSTDSCKVDAIRFGRLVNASAGKCYDSVTFTCQGGPKNGKRISLQAPVGSGGCLSEEKWKSDAVSSCGCGQIDRNFGACKYKKLEFLSGGSANNKVQCTNASSGTCFYEAQITCNDGGVHNISAKSCTKFKADGNDWEFFANVVCCKKIESETVGDTRPQACRIFPLGDYTLCSAYCKERGFSCIANGDTFRCDDNRPESRCL